MKRRLILFIPLLLGAALIFALWLGLGHDPYSHDDTNVGKAMPAAGAPDLFDPQNTLQLQQLRGEPFVLNVWASWCVNCRLEHETLLDIANHIPVYGLNYRDKPAAARAVLAERGNPYRAVFDDQNGQMALALGVYSTPETWLFAADGTLLARHSGAMTMTIWNEKFAPRLTSGAGGAS